MLKQRLNINREKKDGNDYTYLNVNIMNSSLQGENFFASNPQIQFRDSLQYNIVDNPEDYLFSISRFSCEAGVLLPLWSPEIADGQSNPNLTSYSITLSVVVAGKTFSQTTPMIYSSESTATPPSTPTLSRDSDHYYYVYTYSHIVYLFNQMLTQCFTDLQTQTATKFTANCPFMTYEKTSGLFSLYFDNNGEQFTVNFDSNLYNMFYSFYFRNNNQLVIDNAYGLNNVSIGSNTFTKVTQDFVSTSMWSPIETLVFTTTSIPIVPEQNTQPLYLPDGLNMTSATNSQVYQKIITDIAIPVSQSSDYRSYITYTPTFPRYINLNSEVGLKDIDISLFFQDKYTGQLVPICLGNGGCVNMKLCFKRKNIL